MYLLLAKHLQLARSVAVLRGQLFYLSNREPGTKHIPSQKEDSQACSCYVTARSALWGEKRDDIKYKLRLQ